MFIGHYSAAFVAAAHPKGPGLGVAFIAAQLVDIAFFSFVLTGAEAMRITPGISVMNPMDLYDMPYTHSLLGTMVWACGFAALVYTATRQTVTALLAGLVVVSHWGLDWLVHVPDLTIWGSAPKLGAGLWNHPAIEMPLEIALVAASAAVYLSMKRIRARRFSMPVLLIAMLGAQAFNWFGTPPTMMEPSIPITGLIAFMVLAALAQWVASRPAPA